jgi:hypothetical protein
MSIYHKNIVSTENHGIHSWEVANATVRQNMALVASDIGKVALQLDDKSLWTVANNSPSEWRRIDQGPGFTVANPLNFYVGSTLVGLISMTAGKEIVVGDATSLGNGPNTVTIGTATTNQIVLMGWGMSTSLNYGISIGGGNPILSDNISIGTANMLSAQHTGPENIAIGSSCLSSVENGEVNIAIGNSALNQNISGSFNVAMGYALANNTSGLDNIAIGDSVLGMNLVGNENVAIGYGALSATNTDRNVAIGVGSLGFIETGERNVGIGVNAGSMIANSGDNVDSTRSVFVGYQTRALTNGGTNENVFGYQAIGNGSNTVTLGNDSIAKTYLKGETVLNSGGLTISRAMVNIRMGIIASNIIAIQVSDADNSAGYYAYSATGGGRVYSKTSSNIDGSLSSEVQGTAASGNKGFYLRAASGMGAYDGVSISLYDELGGIKIHSSALYESSIPNSAVAIAHTLNSPSYVTAGAKLLSVQNNGVEQASIDRLGIIAAAGGFTTTANSYLGPITANSLVASAPSTLSLTSQKADGASAVGIVLNNSVTMATAGAKLLSIQNNGVEKAYVDKDGYLSAPSLKLFSTAFVPQVAGDDYIRFWIDKSLSTDTPELKWRRDNGGDVFFGTPVRVSVGSSVFAGPLLLGGSSILGINGVAALSLRGSSADGVSAVGVVIDNSTSLATTGSKILSIRNATVEKFYVDKDGYLGATTIKGAAAADQPTFGAELLTGAGWTSTGWTGSWATGWVHTVGNTSVLSNTTPAVVSTKYHIVLTVTGRTAGTFDLQFGGCTFTGLISGGWTGGYDDPLGFSSVDPTALTIAGLTITPTTDFDGTIVASIKAITGVSTPVFTLASPVWGTQVAVRINAFSAGTDGQSMYFGQDSGSYATSGYNNTGLGNQAFMFLTSGHDNTAVGTIALKAVTTGSHNTGLGSYALRNATSGSHNTAFGSTALRFNTTGSLNAALGHAALYCNTTGTKNVGIGQWAGAFLADGITASTSAISSLYIGWESRASALAQTNEIVIGDSAIGNGSNTITLGNASIVSTHLRGYIKQTPVAVASLVAAATAGAGARAFVNNANSTTFASIVAAGGSNVVPVYCDGTDWRIG